MPGWINEIAALAACGLGILLLLVIVRALIFLLKVSAIAVLLAFLVHTVGPELALDSTQRAAVYSYAASGAGHALAWAEAAWGEVKNLRQYVPKEPRGRESRTAR